MFCTTAPQALALFLGALALLVGEYGSFATLQQPLTDDLPTSELAMSLIVNQMTLLKMLNESSVICPLRERDLQEMRDLKLELNATNEEMMEKLNATTEAAISEYDARREEAKEELRDLKDEALTEVDARNQEAKERILEVREATLNDMEAALKRLQDGMETTLNEVNARKEELKQELLTIKEQALKEVKVTTEQLKQELCNETEVVLKNARQDQKFETYKVFADTVTQPEAVAACEEMGGRLALPLNEEENTKIYQLAKSKNSTERSYWIGADDKQEEGKWINSVTGQPLNFTNFHDGQPDNHMDEDCLYVIFDNMKWSDADCDHYRFIYVCEFVEEDESDDGENEDE